MNQVQVQGESTPPTGRVYYAGTASYDAGSAFSYVEDATLEASLSGNAKKNARGVLAEQPTTASLHLFAGCAVTSGTGPGWVDVYKPVRGYTARVKVDGTTDVAVGDPLAIQNGSWHLANFTPPTDSGDLLEMVAVAMEAETDAPGSQSAGQTRLVYFK